MKRFPAVLTAVAWFAFSAIADAQVHKNDTLPTHQQLNRVGLERAWWAQAVLNPNRDKVQHVAIDEEIVYVQSSSGITTAFDAETGRQLWANKLGQYDQQSFPAVSNEKSVLIIIGSTMFSVERKTGRILWTLGLSGQPSTPPALDETHVYYGTLEGNVYALSLRKIRQLFEERRLPQWTQEAIVWKYKAAKEVTSAPITTGTAVNFASRDGSLYSVNATNRKLIYQLETDKPIVAPLARLGNTMYMASEDNTFYSLNLLNGKVQWEFTSGLPIRTAPWPIDNDLYVLPDRGGMYCLEPEHGTKRWWQPKLTEVISVIGPNVAGSDVDGNVVVVSRSRGEIVGSLPLRNFTVRVSNDRTDRIFLATDSGLLVCLRQIGHLFPVYIRYPDRLPLLPEFAPDETDESSANADSTDAQ